MEKKIQIDAMITRAHIRAAWRDQPCLRPDARGQERSECLSGLARAQQTSGILSWA